MHHTVVPDALASLFPPGRRDTLVALRRDLHQHPELAFAEERTATARRNWWRQTARDTAPTKNLFCQSRVPT